MVIIIIILLYHSVHEHAQATVLNFESKVMDQVRLLNKFFINARYMHTKVMVVCKWTYQPVFPRTPKIFNYGILLKCFLS